MVKGRARMFVQYIVGLNGRAINHRTRRPPAFTPSMHGVLFLCPQAFGAIMSPMASIAPLSAQFTAGRHALLTADYCFPLPVYLNDIPIVLDSPASLLAFFQIVQSRLVALGLPDLDGRIVSEELPRNGRFRMWAEWTAINRQGGQPVMQALCFNRGNQDAPVIEMMQITLASAVALEILRKAA